MSILIGTAGVNLSSRERIMLQSDTQSNLIIMKSALPQINIVFDPDGENYVIGKKSRMFQVSQHGSPIMDLSTTSNIFYGPTLINSLQSSNMVLYPNTTTNTPYLVAGNLLTATPDGTLNVGGTTVTNLLRVNSNAYVASNLYSSNISTSYINTQRVSSQGNSNIYIQFPRDTSSSNTVITGDLNVVGTLYAGRIGYSSSNVSYSFLTITSKATMASLGLSNTPSITEPTLQIGHTPYISEVNAVDVNVGGNAALVVDSAGHLQVGTRTNMTTAAATIKFNGSGSTPVTGTSQTPTDGGSSNILALLSTLSDDSILYVNSAADLGIGTAAPQHRLHIAQSQNTFDANSNAPIVGIWASNSDFLSTYSNSIPVFGISNTGDVYGRSFTASNVITTPTIEVYQIRPNSNISSNAFSFSGANIRDINTIYSSMSSNTGTSYTDTLSTANLIATNVIIPNVQIYNILGYYGVFQPTLLFTGSNVMMSSSLSEINAPPPGKLVVRAEPIVGNPTATSVGINVVGTQNTSVVVSTSNSATAQPYYQLLGADTVTYISSTPSSVNPSTTPRMFYINQNNNNTTIDNPVNAQLKILADNGGTILQNNMYITSSAVSINTKQFVSANYSLHVRGGFMVDRANAAGNPPILYAKESVSASGPIYVGIGTTNPNYELHVNGTIYSSANVLVNNMMGIGTMSPIADLHVNGTTYLSSNVGIGTPTPQSTLEVNGNTTILSNLSIGGVASFNSNVGIGKTAPKYALDVAGVGRFDGGLIATLSVASSNQSNINQLSTVTINNLTATNPIIGNVTGSATTVTRPAQDSITVLSNVNILSTTSANLTIGSPTTQTTVPGILYAQLSTPSQPYITSLTAPTVTISTLIATATIQGSVNGSAATVTAAAQSNIQSLPNTAFIGSIGATTTFPGNARINGTLYTYGNVASVSDSNIKSDLSVIQDAFDKVTQLTGYTYRRDGHTIRESGLLAQDVQQVLPEVVCTDTDNLMTISYGNLAGLFVEAFKDVSRHIRQLREEIEELKMKETKQTK